ncbi:protein FAM193A-like isoform X1 [Sinocyclocheilus rhinocerous]|uniref:Protein FAM193A-like n=1 Tax=Sinocyclocheilus rhinocerous TaxID=307959 RepID=A0A673MRK4_9TELE|nr:PREDICTED: protein FAM193A-like isoform X1 [Sinocyclocheilus rhinocerous]
MSPTDAKRGAKRRKNKRGGGGAGKAGAPPTPSSGTAHGDPSTIPSLNREVPVNGAPQFSEGPVNADFSGVLQTPFTFGVNQRAPYTTGDRCLLCRSVRKDTVSHDIGGPSQNGTAQSPKSSSALPLPLYVCSDCKRTVEKDDRQPSFDQSLLNQDFLLHMQVGNGGLSQEPLGAGGRLTVSTPTLPAPDLSASLTADTVCSCEACYERREITAESERESQKLQNHWSEVRYLVRCIYRQTGTPLADDQDQPLDRDKESMKELVDRLCEKDPYQLYQRLEQQAREYVLEMKVRLLKHLSTGSKAPGAVAQGPPQAHQFISLLLEEYNALCQAARTISSFLLTLENEHLQKFQVTWELHNKHLFENLVFSEPILHNSLPALVAQLRQGTTSHDSYSEDMYCTLLERYHQLDQEMSAVALDWLECEKRIDDYVDEQLLFKVEGQNLTNQRAEPHKSLINRNMSLRTKQRMLKEDAEIFKQKRFFEEQFLPNSRKSLGGDSKYTDTVKQMLSSRLNIPDCPNCNYRRRCTCDDCSLSHILTCGIMDAPMAEDLHLKLPLQVEPPRDYLSEVHPPSMSSGSSGSGSAPGSPITFQQHPRLILPQDGTTTFDDEVPPLSAIYPLSGYEDPVACINGMHSQLSGGEESMTLKDKSSQGSSSSSSSSEGDEEERESGEEPPGQKVSLSGGKNDCPPPSYPYSQVDQVQHQCECHVCNQGNGGGSASGMNSTSLPTTRLHAGGHHFFSEKTAAHPALHLYPHIHGHLPLHNLSHLPRPLLPTLYSTPPLTHSKTLPPSPTSSQTGGKQQVFNPTLPEHVYQSCFNTAGDWNGSLPCPSLKLENLWDTHMMKNWNPSVLLQEPLPGDMLGPPLPDVPLLSSSLDPNVNPHPAPDGKKKKNGAKKKCLFNYQDAFMEASEVVMATSSAATSVSSTATTVQSNEVFHNLGKEDHRHPTPVAPRNSPTSLASLPPFSGTSHPSSPNTHLPSIGTQSFPKTVTQTPGYMDVHQGLCLSAGEQPTTPVDGLVSGPNSVCSDPDCEGHRCEGNGGYEHQAYEGEESQDEDSSSEHSSSTSTSTNQKEGKYCDCCYCEFFGHGGPPAAPTSRNYAEMREKLRLRLTKRKEEQPKKEELLLEQDGVKDHRKVEDLLQFINSAESKPASSSKAAKRARHKQKKLEEKARLEVEARELEVQQQFLKEQRRRQQEEEEALKQELLRLQEMQQLRASKKKKKDHKVKEVTKSENPSLVPATNSPQPLQQTAQSVLEKNMQNGKTQLLHNLIRLSPKEPRIEPESPTGGKNGPLQQPSPKTCKERPSESSALQNGTSSHPESSHTKVKPKQQANGSKPNSEATKRPAETSKASELPKAGNAASPQTDNKAKQKASDESVTEIKRDERTNGKKPQNGGKDERNSPVIESSAVEPPQQNGKVPNNESPQPKSKAKKNKKKKADKTSNSIDDVFLPKDIDLDSVDMDETEREVEYFKRFCLDSARQTRQRLSINWSNFSLKKATFAAH